MKTSQLQLNQIDWGGPRKVKSREETIINSYRDIFKSYSIPLDSQYWTMCGQCFDKEETAKIRKGCEIEHMVSSGLIKPEQFHGVETNSDIYKFNTKLPISANWYNADFFVAMSDAVNKDKFNPAIVFADFIHMDKICSSDISKIMFELLTPVKNVMLVCNLILQCRVRKVKSYNSIMDELDKRVQFRAVWNTGLWKMYENHLKGNFYTYNGSGNKSTIMGTVIFYKKG